MEDPRTWGKAERVIQEAHREWWDGYMQGVIGLSHARTIADALRKEGLLNEQADKSPQEPETGEIDGQLALWDSEPGKW